MTFNFMMADWDENIVPQTAYIQKEITKVSGAKDRYWAIDINMVEEFVAIMQEVGESLIISKAGSYDGDMEYNIMVYNDWIE